MANYGREKTSHVQMSDKEGFEGMQNYVKLSCFSVYL